MRRIIAFMIISILFLTGCTSQEDSGETVLLVAAASSLSDTLSELKQEFESEHPDTTLELNYGASGKLSQQISQGAPVDVFLSADQEWMDQLADEDVIAADTRTDFIQNRLVVISTQNTSFSINELDDLPTLNTDQITIGDPESVPAGKYAEQALRNLNIWEEAKEKFVYTGSAQQTLTYVESGNTEVGIVYASDLERSGLVSELLTIDDNLHDPIEYPAAVIKSSQATEKANAFIQFLQTDDAQAIFEKYGFST
ncbi:molybdate ABC transporter substrate-binding protein [Lentibacillus sp. CBA3610]|uniref:molybdate ABC transporter substrate-binding protein n=1 Tax=Lentibacillus sp. CBA3610 TaxID=2518176 RepID=UPI001595A75E|nr:molybdate ABC transporter substrate-binding protein [Lentibacillus sp. CBA3610]QKY70816.1 molybdate ABC transporter substrate-binding protein [Lentibacillus sp. CBA3610]